MGWMRDETGLDKNAANFVPLTPLSHLVRARDVFPDRLAVVYGDHRTTYAQYYARCSQLADALQRAGVGSGDVVATLIPNIPAQAEAHFGVPACGAVLNTINTRLDVDTVSYIFDHGEAKVVLADSQFIGLVQQAIDAMSGPKPLVIEVVDTAAGFQPSGQFQTYEDFIAQGRTDFEWHMPQDEWESLALNYTSGTTGRPKGVVYHHRGAYLMSMGTATGWQLPQHPTYLYIVPMFHCNGWCHVWTMTMMAGTIVLIREISAATIFGAIGTHKVTHFGGAPIVLSLLVNAPEELRPKLDYRVKAFTAGAPPPAAILQKMA